MSLDLKAIEAALHEPFAPECIQFKPKKPRQNPKTKRWEYLALPYADKRIYEDRLNQIAFGEWSTPYTPPIVAGNKLVIPVTVTICGVSHTDYGEAFLSSTSRKGDMREEENSATEAYSQAFRRACSQFGLGRYLYRLRKLWLPWNPETQQPLVMNEGEYVAWVERLYMDAGLDPRPMRSAPLPLENATSSSKVLSTSATQPTQQQSAQSVDARLLAYLRRELNEEQTIKSCRFYKVGDLAELTLEQALHLSNYIEEKKTATKATRVAR